MKSWTAVILPALLCLSMPPGVKGEVKVTPVQALSIKESTVMFYYQDISTVAPFYEETLGLSKTLDQEWVKIYRLASGSYVGLVQEGEGGFHRVQKENAVMLSILTDDVDGWYEHMKNTGGIEFLKDIYNNEFVPIRAFLVKDPGGYSIEFYQWLETDK